MTAGRSGAALAVRFWGVRGSIATSDPDTAKYGGNTSCLEVRCGKRRLILDAGTGIRYLGRQIMAEGGKLDTDLLLTHTHFDHICGIPFFVPMFIPGNSVRIRAGHLLPDLNVKQVLTELMMAPLFPVPPEVFAAHVEFLDFKAGATLDLGDGIAVRTAPLNHPNGASGYRIDYDGRSLCYITDTEHELGRHDPNVVELCRDADVMVYDSMYTDEEHRAGKIGWGHSTWEECLRVADAANVGTAVIFHHDPDHTDARMDEIAEAADRIRPGTLVAREGMVLTP
ncbi:MAG: MBL fold metallo-hydrolase [Alphaproteobacteria bacterium]